MPAPVFDQTAVQEAAVGIGDQLVDEAVWAGDRANWMTRELPYVASVKPSSKPSVHALDGSIHNGAAGVALFLARLFAATGDDRYRHTASAATLAALDKFPAVPPTQRFGFGAGGVGAIWVAHELSQTQADERLEEARNAGIRRLLSSRRGERLRDLNFGAAGAANALLRIGREADHAPATRLGEWLLEDALAHAEAASVGGRFWRMHANDDGLTGFSHGASGFGWAFAAAAAATGQAAYADAARDAFLFEDAFFDEEAQDWLDRRQPGRGFAHVWCYGSPGIAVARARAADHLNDKHLRTSAQTAIDRTLEADERIRQPGANTCLCHGVAGNADCVWVAHEALGQAAEGLAHARQAAAWIVERYGPSHGVALPVGDVVGSVPSLMTGTAGVGLFLLRAADGGVTASGVVPPS